MDCDVDVLVVGAGPVGLTMAIALRRLGMQVRIVDKASGSNREPRADVLFPRAGEVLGSIGVGHRIRDNSYQMQGAQIYGNGKLIGSFRVGNLASEFPRAMTIEQHEIEHLLADELAQLDVEVEWRTQVTGIHRHDDRVDTTLRISSGAAQETTTAWVVACDGSRSQIRDWLGIAFEGKRRRNMQVVQGNVVPSWHLTDEPGNGYFFLAPRRSIIAFPTPAGGYRIFCVRDDPTPDLLDPPTLDELRDLISGAAGIPDLHLELTEPVWLSRARFSDRIAASLRSGRVLLAGDAAHAWAPIGGHGMNVGMLGAHNLAWKLVAVHRGEAVDGLLDTYSIEQRALARSVIRDMKFNVMEALLPAIPNRLRCAVLRASLPSPKFQQRGEWIMSDFGRHHGRSPLTSRRTRRPRTTGVRAGDRMPDIDVVPAARESTVDSSSDLTFAGTSRVRGGRPLPAADQPTNTPETTNKPVPVHRLLAYDKWTLLLSAHRADTATLLDLEKVLATTRSRVDVIPISPVHHDDPSGLGMTNDFHLVRPDGYVGLVAPVDRIDVLQNYCATFFTK